jgi:pilus assembly protein Flp/PilA
LFWNSSAGKIMNLIPIRKQERAQGMVEYGLILVLVAVVSIVVIGLVGSQLSTVFSQLNSALGLEGEEDEPSETYEQWSTRCFDYLGQVIEERLVTHVRIDEFIDGDGRTAYRCLVHFDSNPIPEQIDYIFYP